MWSLRRLVSNSRKVQGLAAAKINFQSENGHPLARNFVECCSCVHSNLELNPFKPYFDLSYWKRGFSSLEITRSEQVKDDLKDLYPELRSPPSYTSSNYYKDNFDPYVEDSDVEDENFHHFTNNFKLEDEKINAEEVETEAMQRSYSDLFRALCDVKDGNYLDFLDRWSKDGKKIDKFSIILILRRLRKNRIYSKALQISDWLEANRPFELDESHYSSHLDLIAKVRGFHKAENFIKKVPDEFRGLKLYGALMASCVYAGNVQGSEKVFQKVKYLGLPLSTFFYDQLLLLYKRCDKWKICGVLRLMEKDNVKPSSWTHSYLISIKGSCNDISGMERQVSAMKRDGFEPSTVLQAMISRYYASGGLVEKAEAILKELDGGKINEQRWLCRYILPVYALLGKADEVSRIWKICESETRTLESVAAIESWGILKSSDKAEAVFNIAAATGKRLSPYLYYRLLQVFVGNKEVEKGKKLVSKMYEDKITMNPFCWNLIVKLYVYSDEVEKVDHMLLKAIETSALRPTLSSYMAIMEVYAKRGDITNAENVFRKMKKSGCRIRIQVFSMLLDCYNNAKAPAYGIEERIKAENIPLGKALRSQLAMNKGYE